MLWDEIRCLSSIESSIAVSSYPPEPVYRWTMTNPPAAMRFLRSAGADGSGFSKLVVSAVTQGSIFVCGVGYLGSWIGIRFGVSGRILGIGTGGWERLSCTRR